ncbi:DNA-3-methyladenine glycosylase II [Streptococcus sp. DD11]|nr:DNA-3-methyladenine glycosylase II [Streptococcus sp. DD11]
MTWGILGQQVNLAYAYTLKERFVKKYGEAFHWHHETYWVYPKPETIANSKLEELLELQMTRKKAE